MSHHELSLRGQTEPNYHVPVPIDQFELPNVAADSRRTLQKYTKEGYGLVLTVLRIRKCLSGRQLVHYCKQYIVTTAYNLTNERETKRELSKMNRGATIYSVLAASEIIR